MLLALLFHAGFFSLSTHFSHSSSCRKHSTFSLLALLVSGFFTCLHSGSHFYNTSLSWALCLQCRNLSLFTVIGCPLHSVTFLLTLGTSHFKHKFCSQKLRSATIVKVDLYSMTAKHQLTLFKYTASMYSTK